MTNVEKAIERLIGALKAPAGAVVGIRFLDDEGPFIRLLVDPLYWYQMPEVPSFFEGYRVRVEKKQPTVTFA